MNRALSTVAVALLTVLLPGCITGPNYERPKMALPDQWSEPMAGGETAGSQGAEQWWTVFGDEQLDTLIERAVGGSFELRIAEARLKQARAVEGIVGADAWPQVGVSGTYQRSQAHELDGPSPKGAANLSISPGGLGAAISGLPFGAGGPSVTVSPDLTGGGTSVLSIGSGAFPAPKMPDRHNDLYRIGFDAGWELDIFGGLRREREAARADTESVEEGRRGVLISVAAEVARTYFELRAAQNRLEVVNKNIEVQSHALYLAKARYEAGLVSELDPTTAGAQLAASKSLPPLLEAGIQGAIHRVEVLIGQTPGTLQAELAPTKPLAQRPPEVPTGLPTDILRRRPDVRQAERAVAAATARIGVAEADLYPHFVLGGTLTGSSSDFDGILRGANRLWSFGPSISWPMFDGGRIRANIRLQNARQEETVADYEKTVTTALGEVETYLVAYAKEQNRLVALEDAVEANRHALALAKALYSHGQVSFLQVLDAERSLLATEDQRIQSEASVLTHLVALHKALGGGWESTYPEGPVPQAAPTIATVSSSVQ